MKQATPTTILLAAIITLIGCTNTNKAQENSASATADVAQESDDAIFMVFERTPCFGQCPAFRVHLYRSGYATYEGTQFSEYMGMHKGKLGKDIPEAILAEAEKINFFDLQEKYDGPVTDLPSMIIDLRSGKKQHKVLARVDTPAELKTFGKYLDNIFDKVEWTKVQSDE